MILFSCSTLVLCPQRKDASSQASTAVWEDKKAFSCESKSSRMAFGALVLTKLDKGMHLICSIQKALLYRKNGYFDSAVSTTGFANRHPARGFDGIPDVR